MVAAKEIIEFINSNEYKKILSDFSLPNNIQVNPNYTDTSANFAEKKLRAAGATIEEVKATLTQLKELADYSVRKYHETHGIDDDTGLPDAPEATIFCGYSRDYLLNNILEIIMAKKGRQHLERYLGDIRIPGSKKYASQILKWLCACPR